MTNAFIQAAQPSGDFLKFKEEGTSHTIKIDSVTEKQATDYRTKEPLTFPSGDPIMEQWISGEYWDEAKEEVVNAVIVVSSKRMRQAIGKALIEANVTEPQPGGVLTVTYTGRGQGANPDNPPKLYTAEYKAPEPVGNPWTD